VTRGLDWDAGEVLVRADVARELRVPHGPHGGEWTKSLVPASEAPHAAELAGGGAVDAATVRALVSQVAELRARLDDQSKTLRREDSMRMQTALNQMRHEESRMIETAQKIHEEGAAKDEHRHELVRAIAAVLGLVAVGALILATAGAAVPPMAAAGVAVGPLIGSELITFLHHQAAHRRKTSGTIGQAGTQPRVRPPG